MDIKRAKGSKKQQPFEVVDPSRIKSFEDYKEEAKQHLVETVKSYATTLGEAPVDEMSFLPEKHLTK